MLKKLLTKLLGDPNAKYLKKLTPIVEQINVIEKKYQTELKLEDLPLKTAEFKKRIAEGAKLEEILPEAFALVKYTCRLLIGKKWLVRNHEITWDMIPYDVQLIGGIVLHEGKIAEMKTGEGKTLVCTMPIYLNALFGGGIHVVTVNEYLAFRDAEWMSGIYQALGLTVGTIYSGQSTEEKKAAYKCDITYGTNNEFGFDYLRDNMATDLRHCVQGELKYGIVDEVDSILIDEARTPLIISAPSQESTSKYIKYSTLIPQLKENEDYNIDEKMKMAALSEKGITKMEELLQVDNIYTDAGFSEVHHIEQALKAHTCYKKDIDYVVKDNEVIIVDEFTGRLMPGRRYSEGLHQAIEAKEKVEVRRESKTLATITFQNYFRLYKKLAGMTGTAATEAEEFYKIYGLDTICIPTNLPIIRKDLNDAIYKNEKGKFLAVINKVKELYEKGQPVLIGTISIEKSELLSRMLQKEHIPHQVLNAKYHEKEAAIISEAGKKKAVTIATNMAGRGTDIKLKEGVTELGGLYILGTERHESRRIDNQLRGRSGRQGDPGISQFFVSMEDSLMRLFGADRIKNMMNMMNFPEDLAIENKFISRSIEGAQKRVEGHHFDIRKHVVEFDDVMNKQRNIIYTQRRKILENENIKNDIILLIEKEIEDLVLFHTENKKSELWNYKEILETLNSIHKSETEPFSLEELMKIENQEELIERIKKYLLNAYATKESLVPDPKIFREVEKNVYLRSIDILWMEHIDEMAALKDAVALRGYGQRDPLNEYKQEGYEKFKKLLKNIQVNTVYTLFHLKLQDESDVIRPAENKGKENSAAIEKNLEQDKDLPVGINKIRLSGKADFDPQKLAVNRSSEAPMAVKKDKIGRNDLCPCGSQKKYKKCCGK